MVLSEVATGQVALLVRLIIQTVVGLRSVTDIGGVHAKQQTIAMVDTETGEFTERKLLHEGNQVGEFYAALEGPVVVGIEATGAMQRFLDQLEELGIEYRLGHAVKIRVAGQSRGSAACC